MKLIGRGFLLCGLLGLNGCDYWPPALQTEIEALRADLEEAMDERQQLTVELAELRTTRASMEQEVEEKARRNNELEQRLAALSLKQKERLASARAEARAAVQRSAARTTRRTVSASRSPIVQGSFSTMSVTTPVTRGKKVVQLQRLLRRHDLPVRVDGIYGTDTAAAVRWYQRRHGLPADGIVGPATYRSLRRAEPAAKLVRQLVVQRPPLKGQDVTSVQRALRRAGYRIAVDGRFGPTTETALMRFQRKHGLRADGVVGPRTWALLTK
ncbi:MAG TPA: peptidoglycan-binding protein [Nitrospira sp.]